MTARLGPTADATTAGALLAAGSVVLAPTASAAGAQYADWTQQATSPVTGSMTVPLTGFPAATYSTTAPTTSMPTGASTWLGTGTPFGARFGSSQDKAYLNQTIPLGNNNPAVVTYTFASATAASGWAFALGDIDADQVTLAATDENGAALTTADFGYQGVFNYCSTSPKPSGCPAGGHTDVPTWDAGTLTLRGSNQAPTADTNGAAGWFSPSK